MDPQLRAQLLEARIKEQIASCGPVTFAQFMEWALYDPEYGYYTCGPNIGPRGDFTTSPEASPAFGRLLANHVADIDSLLGSPEPLDVVECGPGRGTLAASLLDALASRRPSLYGRLRYWLVEISPALATVQRERLLPAHEGVTRWAATLEELPGGLRGAVIANELVDAFPVHVVEECYGDLCEVYVGPKPGDGLEFRPGLLSDPRLAGFLREAGIDLKPGQRLEINLAVEDWLSELSGKLGQGIVTLIDYGDEAPARYSESRLEGTLLAYYRGAVTDSLLARPGLQDLTALVDFTALQRAASAAGFEKLAMTRQANFLLGLGLGTTETAASSAPDIQSALEYRRGLQSLISMEGLGRFHVLVLSKDIDPVLARKGLSGLQYASI